MSSIKWLIRSKEYKSHNHEITKKQLLLYSQTTLSTHIINGQGYIVYIPDVFDTSITPTTFVNSRVGT